MGSLMRENRFLKQPRSCAPRSLHAFKRDAPDLEAWHPFIITICGHDGQIAFQSGGGNKRVDIADQTRAMRRSERAADFSIAFQDGVGEEIRIYCAKQGSESQIPGGIVLQALHVLDDLAVDQDTRCGFAARDPWNNEVDGRLSALEIGSNRACIGDSVS